MAATTSTTSSRPSSNPRDSPAPTSGRQKSTPNGLRSRTPKPTNDSDSLSDPNVSEQQSHDRLLFLAAHAVGCSASITTVSGDQFSGIFSAASLEKHNSKYVLKMTKRPSMAPTQQANGFTESSEYVGHGDDHIMTFDPADVSVCTISGLQADLASNRLANGTANNFRTDTDISGNLAMRERELTPWQPDAGAATELSLNRNGHAGWDQFETNERLYGVKTDYDENMYTTSIDRNNPSYRQRAAAADRKAREIEGSAYSNVHRAGLENEVDEEERFSGVKRDVHPLTTNNPNSYRPPARRAPTATPTVPGAPVDPAIISSQLARPDSAAKSSKPPSTSQNIDSASTERKENLAPASNDKAAAQSPLMNDNATPETSKSRMENRNELLASKPGRGPPVPSPSRSGKATETVEQDVLRSFKDFSNNEKMRIQEGKIKQGKREREVKINDLKKFASNFKLSKPVPEDLIGILAKDKKKQDEIIAKAHREAEEKKAIQQKPAIPPEPPKATVPTQPDTSKVPPTAPIEPSANRARAQNSGYQNVRREKFNNSFGPAGAGRGAPPPSFGQRLKSQYAPGAMSAMPPTGPAALQTDIPFRQSISGVPSSASSATRFNANASEFRPNPTASTFSPTALPSSMTTSQAPSRPVSKAQSPIKRSFFEGPRPQPSQSLSIRDAFNPIKRMKKEVEAEGKSKDFESNDGIPHAYFTRPTWDARPENENKSYSEMFEHRHQAPPPPSVMSVPHQHQLPPHLQQNPHMMPQMPGPHHVPRYSQPPPMHHGNAYHQEDHRMQLSTSQSSHYQSPRMQHNVMGQPSPMPGQSHPVYMQQPQQHMFVNQQGVPMGYMRPASTNPGMFNAQTGQMQPMMMNAPPNAQFMPAHGQPHMQMYSPAPGQAYPGPGNAGTPNYSPRAPPMMVQQGSQQGHGAPMMYMSQSQQGQQPMYYSQSQGQPVPMRGGYPMQPQASYGASPHVQHQYPAQRPPQQFGGFPHQQMHPGQPMPHPTGPHGEVK